ncbi:MAG: imm11 family protein, partial [Archangium sp.]
VWPSLLMQGEPAHLKGVLKVSIRSPGRTLDFSHAAFSIPIVDSRVAPIFAELAPKDVQLIPVEVGSQPEGYFILNATRLVKCIDDEASEEVRYWTPADGLPEKVGMYFSVFGMRIDPTKVGDAKVFRTWGWTGALIVSEDIKQALERVRATGMKFEEVTGRSPIRQEERERSQRLLDLRRQTDAARGAVWRTLGKLDKEAIIPLVVGGSWPARRKVWRVIHRPEGRTLLVTDGLSDFFVDREEPSVGFGMELAVETDAAMKDISKSWPYLLLERVGDEVAEHEPVRQGVMAGLYAMQVSGKGMPESLVTEEGKVGVLLGVASRTLPQHFSMPAGEVRLVTVKALLPAEWVYLLKHGTQGRDELARRFAESGEEHLSPTRCRPMVV